MQIDFHHTVIYVLSRLAGFSRAKALTLAYASQYVDDATSTGVVNFDNKALYARTSSAHKALDIRNTQAIENHRVWIPFHFLPGNEGKVAGKNPDGGFIRKLVTRPDSPIARHMLQEAINRQNLSYGLHRFGVALHVYADTFSHQGFAGVLHEINEVEDAVETGNSGVFSNGLGDILRDILDDTVPPLGHARATHFPDLPFLKWQYKDGTGETIPRDNPAIFMEACDKIFKAMKGFIDKDPSMRSGTIPASDRRQIETLFSNLKNEDGHKRHKKWLAEIVQGAFSFGKEKITYAPRGLESWKAKALGTSHDLPVHSYKPNFLKSQWKLFHDGVQAHRHFIIRVLLPQFGICAA